MMSIVTIQDPVLVDLDDPDYDGDPGSPPSGIRDSKVKQPVMHTATGWAW